MRRNLRVVILVALAFAPASCVSPNVEAKQWDEIQTVEQSVTDLRSYTSDLEGTIDSLSKIVARQDSALRIIVDFTGARPAYRGLH